MDFRASVYECVMQAPDGRGVMTSSIPGRLFAQEGFSKNKYRNDDEAVSFELEHRVIGLVKQTRYTHCREE